MVHVPMGAPVLVPLALVHRRWAIPILALLEQHRGARFAAMRGHLGISRDALNTTLGHLIELGLVERNTGHGHPLRPEYLPTANGRKLGPPCGALHAQLIDLELQDLGLRKWSLPIVGVVHGPARTFSAIRGALDGITPRALSKGLDDLVCAEVLDHGAKGPYALADRGRGLVRPLRSLQRSYAGLAG